MYICITETLCYILETNNGEGNGNPLQYSCLEHPMDSGAWQAPVCGVARVGHNFVTKPPRGNKVRPVSLLLFSAQYLT